MARDDLEDERFALIAERRHSLADFFRTLPDSGWRAPSLCGGWTVREVAGHLCAPLLISTPKFAWEIVRCAGSIDRTLDRLARRYAQLPTDQLSDVLDEHADDRFTPPGYGAIAPLTDNVIHTLDVRWSLDAREPIPERSARMALDFMVSPKAKAFGGGRAAGLRWATTDLDWSAGAEGDPAVSGPADAVLLVLSGRRAGLDEVTGSGATVAAERLAR
ncbi:MAG: hypothetical protein JWN46_3458 [Acidimicrobiales bacterium]|nr:hypothetical protein [Acidimicrobiales bacterium]